MEYCLRDIGSKQLALFGATKSINTMVIDPIQYLDLVNKLEEDAYRGIVGCDFFKTFTKYGPDGLSKRLGQSRSLQVNCSGRNKKSLQGNPLQASFKYV